jgi:sulfite exporter TauE/SafE
LNAVDPALWIAAFMTGMMGSGHCFAMCGGIAGSLGAMTARAGRKNTMASALPEIVPFHLGRLLSYAILGSLAGALVGVVGLFGELEIVGRWLRLATAAMVALIGLRFLLNWHGLDFIEHAGGLIWKQISPRMIKVSKRGDAAGRLLLGLGWGFLPCGLVYTVLLTAGSSGSAFSGSVTMFAFGIGTLPAMLGLTLAAPGLSGLLADRTFRRFIGFSLIVLALWMALTLVFPMNPGHPH